MLVVTRPDGNVDVIDPTIAARVEGTIDASPTRQYRQPVWSPDGRTVAIARVEQDDVETVNSLVLLDPITGHRSDIALVFAPFFLHWRPDSQQIALLDASPLGIELWTCDLLHGESTLIERAAPLFIEWVGNDLIAHVGAHPSDRLILPLKYDTEAPGQFTAVAAHPEGFVTATAAGDLLLVMEDDDYELLAPISDYARFVVAFNGRIALVTNGPFIAGLGVIERNGDHITVIEHPPVAMWWSPDSTTLLFIDVHLRAGKPVATRGLRLIGGHHAVPAVPGTVRPSADTVGTLQRSLVLRRRTAQRGRRSLGSPP
jgi:TolB protein